MLTISSRLSKTNHGAEESENTVPVAAITQDVKRETSGIVDNSDLPPLPEWKLPSIHDHEYSIKVDD